MKSFAVMAKFNKAKQYIVQQQVNGTPTLMVNGKYRVTGGRTPEDRMRIVDVPVDGYWSVTVYNREGYMERNPQEVYTINSVIARHEPDGAVELQFGGCDGRAANCIPIMEGWNYLVRLYRARPEVLDGTWQFPSAEPIEPNVAQRAGRTS